MIETQFAFATPGMQAAHKELEGAFFEQEAVTAATLDSFVQEIAAAIPDGTAPLLVAPLIGAETRATYEAEGAGEKLSKEEFGTVLDGLRRAVADRLTRLAPDRQIFFADKYLAGSNRIIANTGDTLYKAPSDWDWNWDSEPGRNKEYRRQAMRTLYTLPERSPYIAYNVLYQEDTIDPHRGGQILRKLPIQTLDEVLKLNVDVRPELAQTLLYLEQAMGGGKFLADHGLRLTDLAPANIAIDKRTNQALLFDMDGLMPADAPVEGYIGRRNYWPPERRPERRTETSDDLFSGLMAMYDHVDQIVSPIQEAEMVFEFGVTLSEICDVYKPDQQALRALSAWLTSEDAVDRPLLGDALEMLRAMRADLIHLPRQ